MQSVIGVVMLEQRFISIGGSKTTMYCTFKIAVTVILKVKYIIRQIKITQFNCVIFVWRALLLLLFLNSIRVRLIEGLHAIRASFSDRISKEEARIRRYLRTMGSGVLSYYYSHRQDLRHVPTCIPITLVQILSLHYQSQLDDNPDIKCFSG